MKKSCFLLPFVSLFAAVSSFAQDPQPVRTEAFTPYAYKYSIEDLYRKFSEPMIKMAREDIGELNAVNAKGKFKPDLKSLDQHEAPEWYRDAKLGIFFDWGLYSVGGHAQKGWSRARYPDWYLFKMYHDEKEYHAETWGEDFHRDDFIPLFTASNFNAEKIVSLVKESGARYFVPFSKHHDGFCLWDSKYTQRDVVDQFPGRDLTAELVTACEKHGLYHGFYYSVEDYEYPMIKDDGEICIRMWSDGMAPDNAGLASMENEICEEFLPELHNRMLTGKIPVHHFIDDYLVPKAKDYIDKYDPDILWFDGEWQRPAEYYKTPDITAYFYNRAEGRKEVAANDRFGKGTREHHGDFHTSETDEVVEIQDHLWEENRSMSESYGYNWSDSLGNYVSADELVEMLVRIVAKGGNLNLIVNPDGTGRIPEIQVGLLKELGTWLGVNGEAIFGTVPYEVVSDNTQLGQPVWYTLSKDHKYGYAIVIDWPKSETFICKGANMIWESEVYILGHDEPLKWVDVGRRQWGMSAKIPEEMLGDPSKRPCKHAWVLRFEYDFENQFGK
ncbi:MAG: alpha-L-fucosidase [Bacteroidales bacterium]|nr:alpha-L-fucosidase [Bacteroidales bacterium]